MFKNTSVPDRFPTGGQQVYYKLPTNFYYFENSLNSHLSNHLHCWPLPANVVPPAYVIELVGATVPGWFSVLSSQTNTFLL